MESSLFDFFREVVLQRHVANVTGQKDGRRRGGYPPADPDEARARVHFAMKLQQYTGPVQAKGLEDTAFYRYNTCCSRSTRWEATRPGSAGPSRSFTKPMRPRGVAVRDARHRDARHEDERGTSGRGSTRCPECRTNGAGRPDGGADNRTHRSLVDGEPAPDRLDEYRFYQALLGIWPADCRTTPARRLPS